MNRTKKKAEGKARIATYVGREMLDWISREAEKLGLDESAFIRMVLTERMTAGLQNTLRG